MIKMDYYKLYFMNLIVTSKIELWGQTAKVNLINSLLLYLKIILKTHPSQILSSLSFLGN